MPPYSRNGHVHCYLILLLISGFILFYQVDGTVEKMCAKNPAEIIFVLDLSSSIYIEDYYKQMKFVSDLVESFDIGPIRTHVALITFSTNVKVQLSLGERTLKKEIQDIISNIKYVGGGTNTALALKHMRKIVISKARSNVAKVCILITDGMSADTQATRLQAELARSENIVMFVIGIGPAVDHEELSAIAGPQVESQSSQVFTLENYDALVSIRKTLAVDACKVKPMTTSQEMFQDFLPEFVCKHVLDVVFAIDAAKLGLMNAKKIMKFIETAVNLLDLSKEGVHAGLILNKCDFPPSVSLSRYTDSASFNFEIDQDDVSSTSLSSLMREVRSKAFVTDRNGNRTNIQKVAVYFVGSELLDSKAVKSEIYRGNYLGIRTILVVTDNGTSAYAYKYLPLNSSHIFEITSEIRSWLWDLVSVICQ